MIDHIRAGRLKGLGSIGRRAPVCGAGHSDHRGSGISTFTVETYFVLLAPAATPEPVAALIEREAAAR